MRMRLPRVLPLLPGVLALLAVGALPVPVDAQTPYIPYYGKNRVRHTTFEWYIYKTDHFEIFYYPELKPHLERIASYAESAYHRISGELKHDLPFRVPLVLFKTQSEFQLQNISGFELPEGVLAFAEPERNRMVLPIDEPPDQLYRLITHELTHVFEFDIIPRGIMGANLPLWVDEGLANYMAGYWNVMDLMQVRDAALSDNVPKMSEFDAQPLSGRLPYTLGHAVFEFIEAKWGKDGLRQFLFSLRKSVIGGGMSAYEEALKVKPEEFDEQFDRYLKERFRPFRDKERPADYGRDIAPNPQRSHFVSVLSVEPSPSGDMLAVVVGNRKDQELDIVLISARDGAILWNVTKGFDKDRGFEYLATAGGLRGNLVPWISWSGTDDLIAYFARTEKNKTLIVENVVTRRTVQRVELTTVDAPESPAFSPDGTRVAFAGIQNGVADIFVVDLATGALTNVTNDGIADYAPTFAPDGLSIVYAARISGNDKLFRVALADGAKTQLTFGTHDDTSPRFADAETIVFTSTAIDPAVDVPQEVLDNAHIPNIWSLHVPTGELRQWTDTATGIVSPVVLPTEGALRVAFVSYYKGRNGVHVVTFDEPKATVATEDFGAPGPIIDFTPPLSHTIVPENIHRKGRFERMMLAGRPPVGLGVTSGGNFYGNTEITFTDVLGDKQFNFFAQSVGNFRTMALTYVNVGGRLQYALQGFSQEVFYFGQNAALYDPSILPFLDRDLAEAVSSTKGATGFFIYPLNRYTRLELFSGYANVSERFRNPDLEFITDQYQEDRFGSPLFRRGHMLPLGVSFVQETTIFREYGPVAGSTMKVSFDASPGFRSNWLERRTVDADARHYVRLASNGVLALRLRGFKSWGRNPDFMYFGGNSEMRGYDYLEFLGHTAVFANAELRFPLIEAMLTPIGVLGGLRGVFFVNIGGAGFNNFPFRFGASNTEEYTPIIDYEIVDFFGSVVPIFGDPVQIRGLRLVDGRASYGIGLQSFLLGFPMHFDWSWRTLFNRNWENALFAFPGGLENMKGSDWFRKMRFSFWIGYDF